MEYYSARELVEDASDRLCQKNTHQTAKILLIIMFTYFIDWFKIIYFLRFRAKRYETIVEQACSTVRRLFYLQNEEKRNEFLHTCLLRMGILF